MATVYGHDVAPSNDRFVALAEYVVSEFTQALLPGSYLVNLFPLLRFVPSWFPGAGFKKMAAECQKSLTEMQDVPFNEVREKMVSLGPLEACPPHVLLQEYHSFQEQ